MLPGSTLIPLRPSGASGNAGRRRRLVAGLGLGALVGGLALGGFLLHVARAPFPLPVQPPVGPEDGETELVGDLHCHSWHDEGAAPPAEIAEAAQAAGLDFLVITDHNRLEGFWAGEAGYYGGLLLDFGEEVTVKNLGGHLLVYRTLAENNLQPTRTGPQLIARSAREGELTVIAHPFSGVSWRDWDVCGLDGLEVMNLKTVGAGNPWWRRALALPAAPVNMRWVLAYLLRRPDPVLRQWDRLLRGQPVAALGCSDAHGNVRLSRTLALPFPYRAVLGLVTTHLLLDRPRTWRFDRDRDRLYDALAQGRTFAAVDGLADARGFRVRVESDRGGRAGMGESCRIDRSLTIHLTVPVPAAPLRIDLFRDGERLRRFAAPPPPFALTGPGVYRVEVLIQVSGRWVPWIYSSPIYAWSTAPPAPGGGLSPSGPGPGSPGR